MKVGRRPTVSVNGHLQCKRCRLIKLLSSFPSCKKAICGHRGICNSCRSEKRRANRIGIKRGCRKSPITQDGEKWCYACKQVKPIDEYHKNKRAKDGHKSECKECNSRLATQRHRGKRAVAYSSSSNASVDEWMHHLSTPKCKQVKPKKIEAEFACLNCGLLSRRKGGKYCSAKCATLVVWRAQKHVRRARKRGVEHEVIDLPTLLDRDRFKCGICAKAISLKHRYPHPLSPSIDHIIPLSRGGSHTWKNVQASHHACNQEKRTQTMGQLRIC